MAKVQLLQRINMQSDLLSLNSTERAQISATELYADLSTVGYLTCLGTFDPGALAGPTGVINYVLFDSPDLGIFPNIEITDLSYQLTPFLYGLLDKGDFYFFTYYLLSGDDKIIGSDGDDCILAYQGNDVIDGGAGADAMVGGVGNDKYYVDNFGDVVIENVGEGTDTIYTNVNFILQAGSSIQYLRANAGATGLALAGNELANTIIGGLGQDSLIGGAGVDVLDGRAGADLMSGGLDNDTYYVDNPGDSVSENVGEGTDTVYTKINFTISPGNSIQILRANSATGLALTGNEFDNTLVGSTGNDTLNGGLGADLLDGGLGNDALRGSSGSDLFAFNTTLGASNVDTISDFNVVADTIQLENAVFTGLATGLLFAAAFFKGNAAHDADDRIIYNAADGALSFDKDGTGAAAAVRFATVSAGLAITNNDFVVV